METTIVNISIPYKNKRVLSIPFTINGEPYNLTGAIATLRVKTSKSAAEISYTLEVSEYDDPTSGIIVMTLKLPDGLKPGKYIYDIEVVKASVEDYYTVVKGDFEVEYTTNHIIT